MKTSENFTQVLSTHETRIIHIEGDVYSEGNGILKRLVLCEELNKDSGLKLANLHERLEPIEDYVETDKADHSILIEVGNKTDQLFHGISVISSDIESFKNDTNTQFGRYEENLNN